MSFFSDNPSQLPIRSIYHNDPEIRDIVGEFVREMPARVHQANSIFMRGDMLRLHFWAHQLKGGASGYGFPEISKLAEELEQAIVRKQSTDQIFQAMLKVLSLCERVSEG